MTFEEFLIQNGYTDIRPIGDGRWAGLMQFMFTHAIIVGRIGNLTSYDDRWCYPDYEAAKAGLDAWDGTGEPQGWHRHPDTGRRRPSHTEADEYVNL